MTGTKAYKKDKYKSVQERQVQKRINDKNSKPLHAMNRRSNEEFSKATSKHR